MRIPQYRTAAGRLVMAAVLLPGLIGVASRRSVDADEPERVVQEPQHTAPWPRKGDYVGRDACARCHEEEAELVTMGVHGPVVASDVTMGCETCHGPGSDHAKDDERAPELITHPNELGAAAQARLCSRCHAPEAARHGGGGMDGFLAAGIGCTECHFVHEERLPPPMAGVRFRSRAASLVGAEPAPSDRCASCHPLQARALRAGPHRDLRDDEPAGGCARCHGNGSLHVVTRGLARLVTRPDQANDGIDTCRSCHSEVDDERAHWAEPGDAFLTADLGCFACHRVHGEHQGSVAAPSDQQATNRTCAGCHPLAFEAHIPVGSVHRPIVALDAPLAGGCGACHTGSLDHASTGGRPELVESLRDASRAVQERTCLACHAGDPSMSGLHGGAHAQNDVSCTACHSPSAPRARVREDAERGCATCHPTVAARFRLPNRHPVGPDAKMGCSDCHRPHAARPRLHDTRLRQDRCVECHRDYRGPFVFAHQASRLDGCVVCHEPHGSSNRRLLHEASTQQNCLACHADAPAFHDQTPGSVFTNCLNCHTQIHGSDFSRFFFR